MTAGRNACVASASIGFLLVNPVSLLLAAFPLTILPRHSYNARMSITTSVLFRELWTMFKYGLVGLCNTAFSAGIMYLLGRIGVGYLLYTTIAYLAGMTLSFTLNYFLTFRASGSRVFPRLLKFAAVNLSMLGVTQLVQFLLIEKIGIRELFGVILGMMVYTGGGYVLNRLWVFRGGRTDEAD
jgi:putative flippase GtrA